MKSTGSLSAALLAGAFSLLAVFGGLSLSLAEGVTPQPPATLTATVFIIPSSGSPLPTATIRPSSTPTSSSTPTLLPSPTGSPSITPTQTITNPTAVTPVDTLTVGTGVTPTLPSCQAPANWIFYTVQRYDTLTSIARRYLTTVADLQRVNCLRTTVIHIGDRLSVPPPPGQTPSVTPVHSVSQ